MKTAFCQTSNCPAEADLAISTTAPGNRGALKHTIYNDPDVAPRTATRYCILHGVGVAAGLAQLSAAGETSVAVTLTPEGRTARLEQGIEEDK